VKTAMNLWVSYKAGNFLSSGATTYYLHKKGFSYSDYVNGFCADTVKQC
jgi:hypothetical protein